MSDNTSRFSDDQLIKFHQDFTEHVERFNQHEADEKDQYGKLITAQQVNTEAITKLTKSVCVLTDDTREIISTYQDIRGTVRVGSSVQKFILWLLKWGMIGAGIAAIIKWGVKFFH